jgi:hypothetical protein
VVFGFGNEIVLLLLARNALAHVYQEALAELDQYILREALRGSPGGPHADPS